MIHRTTGMTPDDARKKENHIQVKTQLEIHRITKRRYPDINIGDAVKVYQKKGAFDKRQVSTWTKESYKVEAITEEFGHKFYKVSDWPKPFIRHEILKV